MSSGSRHNSLSNHQRNRAGSGSQTVRAYLQVDDSTESEAESSYHGWSDNGWRSENRPSTSSDETPPNPVPEISIASGSGRTVSFSQSQPHRRMTQTGRPSIHTVGSQAALDVLTPTNSNGISNSYSVLNGMNGVSALEVMSPSTMATPIAPAVSGYSSPAPPYPGEYSHPRIRRKSLSHVPVPTQTESDTSADDPYMSTTRGKKGKRNRDGSFSFLPTHRRRKTSNAPWPRWLAGGHGSIHKKYPQKRYALILVLLAAVILFVELKKRFDVKISVHPKSGRLAEVEPILPLRGCFDPKNVHPGYRNASSTRQLLSPGIALARGSTCYDFASTIQQIPESQMEHLTYHTYWRADLLSFGERQMATILAFLATQPLSHSHLIIWTNGVDKVKESEHVKTLLLRWGNNIEVRQVDMPTLTRGTELEGLLGGGGGGGLFDSRAWIDGDAVRLLVLWHFGGLWMDMDQILTRDVHPLAESEFVMQWDCFGEASPFHDYHPDSPYFVLNGALMHFRQYSPYICEAFHIMASSPLPQPNTFSWGSHLYSRLHRRLLAARIPPFSVLPWCFADPRNCDWEVAFPDPFEADPTQWGGRSWEGTGEIGKGGRELLEERLSQVWTVHLHNQWGKAFPPGGWIERLMDKYRRKMGFLRAPDDEVEGTKEKDEIRDEIREVYREAGGWVDTGTAVE